MPKSPPPLPKVKVVQMTVADFDWYLSQSHEKMDGFRSMPYAVILPCRTKAQARLIAEKFSHFRE